MPVPKGKQELYGKIVGHNINTGHSMKEAKKIADKAVDVDKKSSKSKKCKVCGKEHDKGYHQ